MGQTEVVQALPPSPPLQDTLGTTGEQGRELLLTVAQVFPWLRRGGICVRSDPRSHLPFVSFSDHSLEIVVISTSLFLIRDFQILQSFDATCIMLTFPFLIRCWKPKLQILIFTY